MKYFLGLFFVLIQEVLWAPISEINRELKRDHDSESKRASIFLSDAGFSPFILCWNFQYFNTEAFSFHIPTNASLKTKQNKNAKSTEIWLKEEIP